MLLLQSQCEHSTSPPSPPPDNTNLGGWKMSNLALGELAEEFSKKLGGNP